MGYWLEFPGIRATLSISDEQWEEILRKCKNYETASGFLQIELGRLDILIPFLDPSISYEWQETDRIIMRRLPDGLQDVDETAINKQIEFLDEKSVALSRALARVAEFTLTMEQTQKVNEIYAATLGKVPMISSRAFEVFDLSDAQRQEVERIKKELEPEFEKYLEYVVKNTMLLSIGLEKLESEFEKAQDDWEIADATGKSAIEERFIAKEQELLKIQAEIQSQSRAFAILFKDRVFDVLTEEQRKRHQELTDNPPEHVRIFLNIMEKCTVVM